MRRSAARIGWALPLAVLVCGVGFAYGLRAPLTSDVLLLLSFAREVSQGAVLYRDIYEINPPLIIWLQLGMVHLANLLAVGPDVILRCGVLLLSLASVGSVTWLTARLPSAGAAPALRRAVLLGSAVALFLLPVAAFGQREQLVLALGLPFLVLSAGRLEGVPWRPATAVAIGVASGIALALKPQYALVWIGSAALQAFRARSSRPLRSPEFVSLAAVAAAYPVVVTLAAPDYWPLVRMLGGLYRDFVPASRVAILFGDPGGDAVLVGLALYVTYRPAVGRALADSLALASAGFLFGVVIQGKGFDYHYLPAAGSALVLLAVSVAGQRRSSAREMRAAWACGIAFAGFAGWPGWRTLQGALHPVPFPDPIGPVVTQLPPAAREGTVVVVMPWAARAYLPTGRVHEISRGYLWVATALYERQLEVGRPVRFTSPGKMSPAERWLLRNLGHDVEAAAPSTLLFMQVRPDNPVMRNRLDYLALMVRDSAFAAWFGRFRLRGVVAGYRVFVRAGTDTGSGPPDPKSPRRRAAARLPARSSDSQN